MMLEIISRLDEIYSNHLIYRAIIVCDDNNIEKYVNILADNNYNSYILKEYDKAVEYDSLDVRIFLIEKGYFIKFIRGYIENRISDVCFYNSIIIHFDNDISGEAEIIKGEYRDISNNNENEIII